MTHRQLPERVGVAESRDDGGVCLRLYGTQIVDGDIYLYPAEDPDQDWGRSRR